MNHNTTSIHDLPVHAPANRIAPALLLLADISGYTRFMRLHPITTTHAHEMTTRILKALVNAVEPPLRVAEIEGDAVFLYAMVDEQNPDVFAAQVKAQIARFFGIFDREITVLAETNACGCEACSRVDQLKLKQIVHVGPVAVERIGRFDKLIGFDVIVAHRLLKNSVTSDEYVLLTTAAYDVLGRLTAREPEARVEALDGVGEVDIHVFYKQHLPGSAVGVS